MPAKTFEEIVAEHQNSQLDNFIETVTEAIKSMSAEKDIVKQNEAAQYFSVSVNTLKAWVAQGAPEIRLQSGMPMYSKSSIRKWLLEQEK